MRLARLVPALALAATAAAAVPAAAQRAASPAAATAGARTAPAALATYQIDATHSELSFRIRHMLGRVSGSFGEWGGTIGVDSAAPANSRVDVSIKTASIDTQNERRDGHLRSPDFFAADSFPAITFKSTRVDVRGKALKLYGDLTMRGVTRPVVLTGEYAGTYKDAQGKQRAAFTAATTVNRLDYGLKWNRAVETGALLGDEVTIDIAVQAVRQ